MRSSLPLEIAQFLMESWVYRVIPQTFASSFAIALKVEPASETLCDLVRITQVHQSSIVKDLVVSCYDQPLR
jgi:hypothetical protein